VQIQVASWHRPKGLSIVQRAFDKIGKNEQNGENSTLILVKPFEPLEILIDKFVGVRLFNGSGVN